MEELSKILKENNSLILKAIPLQFGSYGRENPEALGKLKNEPVGPPQFLDQYIKNSPEPPKQRKTKFADAIIKNDKNQILLLKRSLINEFCPNEYCLPGGHVELGEDPMDAAMRETEEETGLEIDGALLIAEKETGEASIKYYYCQPKNNGNHIVINAEEHSNFIWIDVVDLHKIKLMLDLKDTLETILFSEQSELPIKL
jgi:mutator protein MutT